MSHFSIPPLTFTYTILGFLQTTWGKLRFDRNQINFVLKTSKLPKSTKEELLDLEDFYRELQQAIVSSGVESKVGLATPYAMALVILIINILCFTLQIFIAFV